VASHDVLVVVHEARRSGPPIFALDVVGWLRDHTALDITVLLLDGGPLVEDFGSLVPTVVEPAVEDRRRLLAAADVVYVNTAISIRALHDVPRPTAVVTHVHELDIGLRSYLDRRDHDLLLEATHRFLVGPACAAQNLVEGHGVEVERIGQVPYFAPAAGASPASGDVRSELGLPAATPLVGACGAREWRKAPDLFTHLAWYVAGHGLHPEPHFLWVGGSVPTVDHWDQDFDVEALGLADRIHFVDHQPDSQRWIGACDVFALTSREDLFPLVCLEAGLHAVPVVCFDNGGIPELVLAADGGRVVPYPDLAAMADAVATLLEDDELRGSTGVRLRDHVLSNHQLEACGQAIAHELQQAAT